MSERDYTPEIREAVKAFWNVRNRAGERQSVGEDADRGERGAVTAGKHLDGFIALFRALIAEAGLANPRIELQARLSTLPGFFRPTKSWDMVVHAHDRLIAVVELKSQVGPSFGNNANNRTEEALGNALDFWTAFREKAFGENTPPFLGYMILVEDCPKVHAKPKREISAGNYFRVFPEFRNASYAERYKVLCEKLVMEKLYSAAAVIFSPRTAGASGDFAELSAFTGLGPFIRELRAKIMANADVGGVELDVNPSGMIREE